MTLGPEHWVGGVVQKSSFVWFEHLKANVNVLFLVLKSYSQNIKCM